MNKNIIVAYHANCTDGFTSVFIASEALNKLGHAIIDVPVSYTEESLNNLILKAAVLQPDEIYIVDFSIPLKTIEELGVHTDNIIILDHHKTAFERYCEEGYVVQPDSYKELNIGKAEIYLDNAKSGAGLCWAFFNSDSKPVPQLVKYVQDYDLWKYEFGEETRYINKYLRSKPMELFTWRSIMKDMEDPSRLENILEQGASLQRAHDTRVATISANAAPCTLLGHAGYFIECPYEYTSDVGHTLATREDSNFGLMFIWPKDKDQLVKFSLRSEGDFDVSAMAKKFGGGGHKNAAGFSLPVDEAAEILKRGETS